MTFPQQIAVDALVLAILFGFCGNRIAVVLLNGIFEVFGQRNDSKATFYAAKKAKTDATPAELAEMVAQAVAESAKMRAKKVAEWKDIAFIVLQVVGGLSILGSALYVILSRKYDEGSQKWAFLSVGVVLGYLFKGKH